MYIHTRTHTHTHIHRPILCQIVHTYATHMYATAVFSKRGLSKKGSDCAHSVMQQGTEAHIRRVHSNFSTYLNRTCSLRPQRSWSYS